MHVRNLHKAVTESDLGELFGLRTTNDLINNCSISPNYNKMEEHVFILTLYHISDELVKIHGLEFHGRKIIIEEAKTPPRTLVYELSTSAVANDQQSMHKMPPTINDVRSRLPTAPTEEQHPIQNSNSTFSSAFIPKKIPS